MVRVVPADDASIAAAARELRAGWPVAFPTETVYGLGADASSVAAVGRVFGLKGRPADHPLIVHLASADQVPGQVRFETDSQQRRTALLAAAFWPGPLTLVLPAAAAVPSAVTGGQATVAVRVPRDETAKRLLEAFGGALVAPSANRFGHVSPTTAAHVVSEFAAATTDPSFLPEAGLMIIDAGASEVGIESTIVDLTGPRPAVLRPGAISASALEAALGESVAGAAPNASAVRVPGTLARHYSPVAPCYLVPRHQLQRAARQEGVAVLAAGLGPPVGFDGAWVVLPDDPAGYAHGLYAALRDLDALRPSAILIAAVPAGADWEAVGDRLARATTERVPREVVGALDAERGEP